MKQTANFLEASKKKPNTSREDWCNSIKQEENKMYFKERLKFLSCFSHTAKQYQCEVYQGPYIPTK